MAQRFADEFDAVEGADGGQDMGRIGALATARDDQFVVAAPGEERV